MEKKNHSKENNIDIYVCVCVYVILSYFEFSKT